MTRDEFVCGVREYLIERKPHLDATRLTPDASLWELGYADSLGTVELILFVERMIGGEIPIDSAYVRSFATIQSIYDAYLKAANSNRLEE